MVLREGFEPSTSSVSERRPDQLGDRREWSGWRDLSWRPWRAGRSCRRQPEGAIPGWDRQPTTDSAKLRSASCSASFGLLAAMRLRKRPPCIHAHRLSSSLNWLGRKDSNLHLPDSESGVLPITLRPNIGAGGGIRSVSHGGPDDASEASPKDGAQEVRRNPHARLRGNGFTARHGAIPTTPA